MKIEVLRKMEYENTFIYIIQFEYVFQYLFVWDKEIYRDDVVLIPSWWRRILWNFNLSSGYTKQQVEEGEEIVLSGAMRSIDKLIENSGDLRAGRREKELEERKLEKKECLWQAREAGKDNEKFYMCLVHAKVIKMVDGMKPEHKKIIFNAPSI